jgi:indolepyruvate ferredoxin oxidoreductase, beta subunit
VNPQPRPITVLIAALGGEGGGVLASWIVNAATASGLPVQSTSIPGVAQRTGATTYYIEIYPVPAARLGGSRPVLALNPSLGEVDLMVASELLEAARVIGSGFVTADRTTVISSIHRVYAIAERGAMGDGRAETGALLKALEANAKAAILFDMDAVARESGSMLNAVMLGVIAGSGVLPIAPAGFEDGLRAEGKTVDANLRGFHAGLERARLGLGPRGVDVDFKRREPRTRTAETLLNEVDHTFPPPARAVVAEGVKRLIRYQDTRYAALYLDRLERFRDLGRRDDDARLLQDVARNLAVRMSFEDVIRVAQAKIDPGRLDRIAQDVRVAAGQPFTVIDFFKPGIEELCALLPPGLARRVLAVARRRGWIDRAYWGMQIKSSSVSGYVRLRMLAALRPWRRRSYRYAEEQKAIEVWLGQIARAAEMSIELAREITECARLIKGYGSTHRRGSENFERILSAVIGPALSGRMGLAAAVDAIASARVAALNDPEGASLSRCLADLARRVPVDRAAE